ncbi:hypothetical protein AMELA_G00188890, partial [Ameiurus melas]
VHRPRLFKTLFTTTRREVTFNLLSGLLVTKLSMKGLSLSVFGIPPRLRLCFLDLCFGLLLSTGLCALRSTSRSPAVAFSARACLPSALQIHCLGNHRKIKDQSQYHDDS